MHGAVHYTLILHGNRHPFGSGSSQSSVTRLPTINTYHTNLQLFSELTIGAHAPFSSMITPPYGFLCSPLGQYAS